MRDFVTADCELTTGAIAVLTGAKMREGDPVDRPIRNIAPLDTAGASDISFLDNSKYAAELATTRAAACLIAPRFVERAAKPRSAGDGAAIPRNYLPRHLGRPTRSAGEELRTAVRVSGLDGMLTPQPLTLRVPV